MEELVLALKKDGESTIWLDDAKFLNLSSKTPIFASNVFSVWKKGIYQDEEQSSSPPRDYSIHNENTSTIWVNDYPTPLSKP